MAASTAIARSGAVPAEARLGLAEFLLTCDDLEDCARRCLEWRAEYAGARAGACLAVDVEHTRLAAIATHGAGLPRELAIDLEDRTHPLVATAFGREPVIFDRRAERRGPLPLGRMPIVAQ